MPARLFGRVTRKVAHGKRPGADKGHLAGKHVEELRQLVEGRRPEEATETRRPLGVASLARAHGAELHEAEGAPALAGAVLAEDDGTAHGAGDGQGDGQGERNPQGGREEDEQCVEKALHVAAIIA